MNVEWRLRHVAADCGIWTAAELGRRMEAEAGLHLSGPSLSTLMTRRPVRLRLDILAALCAVLHCTPNDLIVFDDGRTPS